MNRVRICLLGSSNHGLNIQIGLCRLRRSDAESLIRQTDSQHIGICLGMGLNGVDTHFLRRADNSHSDLAPISNEQALY